MPNTADTAADPATPRVLLFGHPGSGKSSLLGALLQASDTQARVLGVEIVDPTNRLQRIRDHIYTGASFQNTRTEIVSYPVELTTAEFVLPPVPPRPLVLLDCDGDAAVNLLRHLEPLADRAVSGTVAAAVVHSDAIALVVSAVADDKALHKHFGDFLMFLEQVHGRKAFYREVGGFPIFLVLTKCDELAEEGDTKTAWYAKVAARRANVLKAFKEFLEDEDDDEPGMQSPYLPFGSVQLEGYAVAVRRPELDDDPHPPDVPFGVAELFRDVIAAAESHRERAIASDRRLKWTVRSMLAGVAAMALGVAAVLIFQPPAADPELPGRVRAYELHEAPAAVRLAEKNIARRKQTLQAFQGDPGYFSLPDDLQAFVSGRLKEIDDYQEYRARLASAPIPAEARTLEDVARIEQLLATDYALPPEYSWGETEAARLRDKWLADAPLIRREESNWSEWYRSLASRAVAMTFARSIDASWRNEVTGLLAEGTRLPFDPAEVIPGSAALPQLRGEAVTFRVPQEFDRVYQARRDWDFNRARLVHMRDLADAVGLIADADGAPPRVLAIPEPAAGVDSAALPGKVLSELRSRFTRPAADYPALDGDDLRYPEWELRNFPDPARGLLAARVRESFRNGTRHAQRLILAKLGTPPDDTPDGWQRVADSLGEPAFRDWGRLLHLLARLDDPAAANPVTELVAFLGPKVKDRVFPLDLPGFELAIPLELRVPRLEPAGPLTVTLTPRGGGPPVAKAFKPGDGTQQGLVMVYRYRPEAGDRFTYRPGDGLKVEAAVRSGDQRFVLLWNAGGTESFQFDRLAREPRLTRDAQTEPATGVRLTPTGEATLPRVPVLLPDVRK